jgi:hypothetical protein
MENFLRTIILLLAVTLAPLNIYVAYILVRLARKYPDIPALSERAFVASCIALAITVGATYSIVRALGVIDASTVAALILNGMAVVLYSVPAIFWLRKYRKDKFK